MGSRVAESTVTLQTSDHEGRLFTNKAKLKTPNKLYKSRDLSAEITQQLHWILYFIIRKVKNYRLSEGLESSRGLVCGSYVH